VNGYSPLINVVCRIAASTSALRVRADDVARREHNGGTTVELQQRVDVLIARLEKVAGELEDALA
jgi:hypothetical protein